MSTAVQDFIGEVLKRWPPPKTWSEEQEDAWSDDVIAEFSTEKKPIFDQALSVLKRQTRGYSGTPRIEDVIKAVNLAVKEVGAQRRAGLLKLDDGDTFDATDDYTGKKREPEDKAWTTDSVRFAYENLKTEMARTAAREGWLHGLFTFMCTYTKMPTDKDINATVRAYRLDGRPLPGLKVAARAHDEFMAKLGQDKSTMAKWWFRYGTMMNARNERLIAIVEGKDPPKFPQFWAENFASFEKHCGVSYGGGSLVKSSPPSKYADENAEEGRGWRGRTA